MLAIVQAESRPESSDPIRSRNGVHHRHADPGAQKEREAAILLRRAHEERKHERKNGQGGIHRVCNGIDLLICHQRTPGAVPRSRSWIVPPLCTHSKLDEAYLLKPHPKQRDYLAKIGAAELVLPEECRPLHLFGCVVCEVIAQSRG